MASGVNDGVEKTLGAGEHGKDSWEGVTRGEARGVFGADSAGVFGCVGGVDGGSDTSSSESTSPTSTSSSIMEYSAKYIWPIGSCERFSTGAGGVLELEAKGGGELEATGTAGVAVGSASLRFRGFNFFLETGAFMAGRGFGKKILW